MSQEPGVEDEGPHRLRDIVVEEVSLVDRAANKRRFLVVKRSEQMADGRNGVEAAGDEAEDLAIEERCVEKGRKKPEEGCGGGEAEKTRRPRSSEDEGAEEDKTEKARRRAATRDEPDEEDEELEKAGRRRQAPPEEDESEDEGESEEEAAEKADRKPKTAKPAKEAVLRSLTKALDRLVGVAKQVQAARLEGSAALPANAVREISAVAELLEGIGGSAPKSAVVKAGARMAKDRLDRFQKALTLLSEVLKELTESKTLPGPTAGIAEAGVQKRGLEAVPEMHELIAGIGELTRVVKRQESELARIRQARGISNAISVDGGGRRPESQEVSWPLDMNRPISRDSVAKAVSFFDD